MESNKKKSIIRFEAIIPLLIIVGIIYLYTSLFLDFHLRRGIELLGYQMLGAEVNLRHLKSSFWKAFIELKDLEFTNPEKPTHNSLQIGTIRFDVSWDALLRGKILIEEIITEDIGIDLPRKKPGKIAPPEPPKPDDDALEKALAETQTKVLNLASQQAQGTALGDLASLLSGQTNQQNIVADIESQLKTKAHIKKIEEYLELKKKEWSERKNFLPKKEDFEKIQNQIRSIKTSNFTSPQEVQDSLSQFQNALNEFNQHLNTIQTALNDFDRDTKKLARDIQQIESLIKTDLQDLQKYFKESKIDIKQIIHTLVMEKIQPYLNKIIYYKKIAQKYMPPNLTKKSDPDSIEVAMQPRPRHQGVTYEFGKVGRYPLFWIKKISISSKANPAKNLGDMKGVIENITSHQALIQRPTSINFQGDFPNLNANGIKFQGLFDNRNKNRTINYHFLVTKYLMEDQNLLQTNDVKIKMLPQFASFESKGTMIDFKKINLSFIKNITTNFDIQTSHDQLKDFLIRVFSDIQEFSFTSDIIIDFPQVSFAIDSNFGRILGNNITREIKNSLNMAKDQIEKDIKLKLEQEKINIQKQIKSFELDIQQKITNVKSQLEEQKQSVERQKKEFEQQIKNQAQQKINEEKNKLEKELKKKLGL